MLCQPHREQVGSRSSLLSGKGNIHRTQGVARSDGRSLLLPANRAYPLSVLDILIPRFHDAELRVRSFTFGYDCGRQRGYSRVALAETVRCSM